MTVPEHAKWQLRPTAGPDLRLVLTQRVLVHRGRCYDSIEHGWYQYLDGHELCLLRNDPDQDFDRLAEQADAVIITGGDDSAIRRITEIRMATATLKRRKPIVGFCHGSFLLTDIMGGTVSACADHMDAEHPVFYQSHQRSVNSFHSQTITKQHRSATILATDLDGNVEAWLDDNIAGVTWHPQRMSHPWLPLEIADLLQ